MLTKFSFRTAILAATATLLIGCGDSTENTQTKNAATEVGLAAAEDRWRQPLFSGLGGVDFPITTSSAAAQNYFNQGLALSYAFKSCCSGLRLH